MQALTLMEERKQEGQVKAEYHVIKPKSITMGQLYGQVGPKEGELQQHTRCDCRVQ